MILVALGANLPTARHGSAAEGLDAALTVLAEHGVRPVARSRWYRSAPVPPAEGPWFVNGVVRVETTLSPVPLMARLLAVEAAFGRTRSVAGAARPLDLDLLDYGGQVIHHDGGDGPALVLPHPRLAERAFVLAPLIEVAPDWRHPVTGASVATLLAAVADQQALEPLPPAPPNS
ncbi:MAG: 2-amino-4-hydroxy-6-hydroxymethyldihydropteridine diphosphokinase [Rhodospirillales bacterium]|nr:2-amino-4-hydroxy-6-hydroxymethyldihydropteridine diphosphokinase [Rhodospirillales bacterium]